MRFLGGPRLRSSRGGHALPAPWAPLLTGFVVPVHVRELQPQLADLLRGQERSNGGRAQFRLASAAVNNYALSGDREQYYEKVGQSRNSHEVARRVTIQFHDLGDGSADMKSSFQVRSAYRNESDFRINQLRAASAEDSGPRIARIIDVDTSVSKNYERLTWKGMQDLHRDAPEELTIGEYRRGALGDLQKAMRGLFTDPGLSLQDFGGIRAGSFRFSKGGVSDFHYKNFLHEGRDSLLSR